MSCQLPTDCLNEIFECLEDKVTLRSCLLVNRLWCEVSVQILWTSIQNYNTLIACLPDESKEILYKNEIVISTPTSKPPLFNYVALINTLSIGQVIYGILKNLHLITSKSFDFDSDKTILVMQEMFKMFMNHINLKTMIFFSDLSYISYIPNIPFTTYPGAIDCLRYLSELKCDSNLQSEFFCQMSQICYNLQSLKIVIRNVISDGLADLISIQQNLKYLTIFNRSNGNGLAEMFSLITNPSNNLIKLHICEEFYHYEGTYYTPLSFIAKFTSLQELVLSIKFHVEDFKTL